MFALCISVWGCEGNSSKSSNPQGGDLGSGGTGGSAGDGNSGGSVDRSGQEGEDCRVREPFCNNGLVCILDTCEVDTAGQEGRDCRDEVPLCNEGLVCENDQCVVDLSGQEGRACRDEVPLCEGQLICQNNICTNPAGQEGQVCRNEAPICNLGLVCENNRCQQDNSGQDGGVCRVREPFCNPGFVCNGNQRCEINPACPADSCVFGEQVCADADSDGVFESFHICGGRIGDTCTDLGTDPDDPIFVECDSDRTCQQGQCQGEGSASPKVGFMVDRGGFDAGVWPAWRNALLQWSANVQPTFAIGAQTFPSTQDGEECSSNTLQAASSRNTTLILENLFNEPQPPTTARPLHGIVGRSLQLVGRPSEMQITILITFGGETCADPAQFIQRVSALRGRGIRTRILRVVLDGNDEVVDELHAAGVLGGLSNTEEDGGLGYANVTNPEELLAELEKNSRFVFPQGCLDQDEDGYGYLCPNGLDCHDLNPNINPSIQTELCDNFDQDCDGEVDEVAQLESVPIESLGRTGSGICQLAPPQCIEGNWQEQDYEQLVGFEEEEITCDGFDNDCDNQIDENTVAGHGDNCSVGVGECERSGRRHCLSDAPGQLVCTTRNLEIIEAGDRVSEISLDGLDNDCDGQTDEVHPDCGDQVGDNCELGVGECENSGIFHCEVDVAGNNGALVCVNRLNGTEVLPDDPSEEIFDNGRDEDCDGAVDERVCDGVDPDADRAACAPNQNQDFLGCSEQQCVLGCNEGFRNGPGGNQNQLTCQTPGSYTEVSLGNQVTCLIDPDNSEGVCYGSPDAPVIDSASRFKKIAAGGRNVCLLPEGVGPQQTICFGSDADFLSRVPNTEFVDIALGEKYQQAPLTDSATACGLTSNGWIECWSSIDEHHGLFPVPETTDPANPKGDRFVALTVGSQHICGVDNNGKASCWGECNAFECDAQSAAPQRPDFVQISAGDHHTCALDVSGNIYCWGAGINAGNGCPNCFEQSRGPADRGFRKVVAGGFHSCAINQAFEIECWGLADGNRTNPPFGKFTDIWAGRDHTCAKRTDGAVRCWGVQLGNELQNLD